MDAVRQWLDHNIGIRSIGWEYNDRNFWFTNEMDATIFALKWMN